MGNIPEGSLRRTRPAAPLQRDHLPEEWKLAEAHPAGAALAPAEPTTEQEKSNFDEHRSLMHEPRHTFAFFFTAY